MRVEPVGGDGVVGARGRGVDSADAVFQDTHAVLAQTADDRTAGAGAEERRGYTGLSVERVAEPAAQVLHDVLAPQNVGALQALDARAFDWGGDDDFVLVDGLGCGSDRERSA